MELGAPILFYSYPVLYMWGGYQVIRDNGDVVEALLCMGAWFVLTIASIWVMGKVENIYNKIKGRS